MPVYNCLSSTRDDRRQPNNTNASQSPSSSSPPVSSSSPPSQKLSYVSMPTPPPSTPPSSQTPNNRPPFISVPTQTVKPCVCVLLCVRACVWHPKEQCFHAHPFKKKKEFIVSPFGRKWNWISINAFSVVYVVIVSTFAAT